MKACIYENGKIFTSDKKICTQRLCLQRMELSESGQQGRSRKAGSQDCERVDLQGRRVIPGFVDAHMHPLMLADYSRQISALPPKIRSIEELIQAVREKREEQGPGKWCLGWGYDEGKFAERRSINRWDLDKGCSDSPVSIVRTCGHIRCVNSKALELARELTGTPRILREERSSGMKTESLPGF